MTRWIEISGFTWKEIAGTMRLLHTEQENRYSPPPPLQRRYQSMNAVCTGICGDLVAYLKCYDPKIRCEGGNGGNKICYREVRN